MKHEIGVIEVETTMTEPELTELPKEKGLYKKYFIQKIVRNPDYLNKVAGTFMGEDATPEFILKPTDSDAEYFVLRLDDGCSDPIHVEACRQAVLTYATVIRNHLPELSEDLFKKYSKNTIPAEPELTKLPDNFYFQYVDEKDREVLRKRFRYNYIFSNIGSYYGKNANLDFCRGDKDTVPENSTEITQQDFIRLTEPATTYKGDIKDFPKEVVEWMMDNQVKQGNKRDVSVFEKSRSANKINGGFNWDLVGDYFCTDVIVSKNFDLFFEKYPKYTSTKKSTTGQIIEISERGILIELTKEQIKEFKIFETVTIK